MVHSLPKNLLALSNLPFSNKFLIIVEDTIFLLFKSGFGLITL